MRFQNLREVKIEHVKFFLFSLQFNWIYQLKNQKNVFRTKILFIYNIISLGKANLTCKNLQIFIGIKSCFFDSIIYLRKTEVLAK